MKIKDLSYFIENGLNIEKYYSQFETARELEVGKTYLMLGLVYWHHFKVIWIGDGVAVAEEVANGNNNFSLGSKIMLHAEGFKAGWVYRENRSALRLVKEIN